MLLVVWADGGSCGVDGSGCEVDGSWGKWC